MREAEQNEMLQLVAGVLHMGNVDFDLSEDGESSTLQAATRQTFSIAAMLLGQSGSTHRCAMQPLRFRTLIHEPCLPLCVQGWMRSSCRRP